MCHLFIIILSLLNCVYSLTPMPLDTTVNHLSSHLWTWIMVGNEVPVTFERWLVYLFFLYTFLEFHFILQASNWEIDK